MFKELPGIYMIKCNPTGKYIIGETGNVKKRLNYHIQDLKGNRHKNPYLQKAWNKYGEDKFSYHVLEYCDFSECKIREDYYCKLYDSHNYNKGFNLRPTGLDLKNKFSQETKNKIKESLRTSEKFKNRDTGKGMRGKKHSEETKLKISEAHKGKIISKETRIKLSKSLKGRIIKKESIEKIIFTRKNNNNVWHTNETKQKISKSSKGKPKSKSHCNNMKLARYKPILQYDLNNNFIKEWLGASQVRDELGYNQSNITGVCNGLRKTHKNFIWKYKEKVN